MLSLFLQGVAVVAGTGSVALGVVNVARWWRNRPSVRMRDAEPDDLATAASAYAEVLADEADATPDGGR